MDANKRRSKKTAKRLRWHFWSAGARTNPFEDSIWRWPVRVPRWLRVAGYCPLGE